MSLRQSELVLAEFEGERGTVEGKLKQIEEEIERMEPVILQVRELQTREDMLVRLANEKGSQLSSEVSRLERIDREAAESLEAVSGKDEVVMRLLMARSEIDDVQSRIEQMRGAGS